ncbi:MAG: histidine kinase [Prolixibacteraceae bacterium]|nr:histidine kinase [Prolixibacteraceae bacterium]MBT6006185.1 histidine kinase [Prolixibacteraceae bacterium]MBT6765502.1 histidine kinase [Prolixibacteraceae bacterium]MBT6997047.1 histidine kinase [Prolixibacteraceae bacterium]MBT7396898.1 histidine kinase [Prolixibacteraceae bacterium]
MRLAGKNIDKAEILLHIIFWLSWIFSFTIIQSLGKGFEEYFVWFLYYVITLPIFVAHTYLIAYWLLSENYFRHRYFLFGLGFILLLIVFSALELVVSNELVFKPFDVDKSFSPGYLNFKNILISGIGNLYIILVFLAIKAGRSWYSAKNRKEELLQSKMETELEIYRYQLQPRLILTLMEELEQLITSDSDKAPEMIIKISNFLNRFLYEGREELIPLQLEVKLIEEFLDIHKLAIGDRLTSNFIVSGNLKSFVVPPLLLLPFLNNAIKMVYGCNDSFESSVIIKGEKKYLLFSFSIWSENEFRLIDDENTEITKKRLNYSFPGKYRLIENLDENFREFSLEIFN